jgi:AcrR family transcriptional regulator/DNA/RNA-binding domain of Phe-tRNA-synthetase-like protein
MVGRPKPSSATGPAVTAADPVASEFGGGEGGGGEAAAAGARARPAGRLARRKARTVSAILDASERHFLERGFESAKVDLIAHDADVSVGSLYNHFGGKEALYTAVVERALDLFETYMEEDRDSELSALERVLDIAGRLARFARERPGQMRLLCLIEPEPAGTNEDLREISGRVSKAMATHERRTAALIEVAIRRGQVRPIGAREASAFLWASWKGMLTLGPRAERAAPGRDRELRALLEAGLRIVVGGLASDEAREHDKTVRAIIESARARTTEPPEQRPLKLLRAPVANDLRADFPELAIWTAELNARAVTSPDAVRRRLEAAGDRVTGADAIGTRSESTPWAYRVFARRLGIDPDSAESAVEAAAMQRGQTSPPGSLPEDAQLIAVAETGVPVLAFDADRIDGDLWLRRAAPGERVGDHPVEPGRPVLADRTRAVAAPFGPSDQSMGITPETERMTLVALQVKGVPDLGVEEALWTVVEIAQASQ